MTSASEQIDSRTGRSAKLELFATYAAALALPAMAVSISVTQIAIGLAFVLFFGARLLAWRDRNASPDERRFFPELPAPFIAGALYFAWLILGGLIAAVADPFDTGDTLLVSLRRAVRSEWSDLPLYLFGLLVLRLGTRTDGQRRVLFGGLTAFAVLIVASGAASVFTEYRLARVAMAWLSGSEFIPGANNRPQHPFGSIAGLAFFRPIGFMNTRLTYAGLLILILPHLIAGTFFAGRRFARILAFALAAAGCLVLAVNGTRSALFGFVVGGMIFLPVLFWRDRHKIGLPFPRLSGRDAGKIVVALLIACTGTLVFTVSSSSETAQALRARVMHVTARMDRHTDYSRMILWTAAGDLALARPAFGSGAGNFEIAGERWRDAYVRKHPETLYYVKNTPRGHAHNDLLHIAAVGGFPAALCFLALIFLSTRALQRPASTESGIGRGDYLLVGSAAFFLAGFAQCYFQDDEVVTLFWVTLALAHCNRLSVRKSASRDS